jgi:hypothetical protein
MKKTDDRSDFYSEGEIALTVELMGRLSAAVRQQRAEINALRARLSVAEKRLALRAIIGGRDA